MPNINEIVEGCLLEEKKTWKDATDYAEENPVEAVIEDKEAVGWNACREATKQKLLVALPGILEDRVKKLSLKKGDVLVVHRSLAKRELAQIEIPGIDFKVPIVFVDDLGEIEDRENLVLSVDEIRLKIVENIGWFMQKWQDRPHGADRSDLVRKLAVALHDAQPLIKGEK